jgi:hypothetical protein
MHSRRIRNVIARGESMAFVAEISNQLPSGFRVDSQECSTVNGYAESYSQCGNPLQVENPVAAGAIEIDA